MKNGSRASSNEHSDNYYRVLKIACPQRKFANKF